MKKKSVEIFEGLFNSAIKYFKWDLLAAALLILLTGIYNVDSSEVAVVLRFGALTGETRAEQIKQPGLHFALPNFIDEVVKVPVERIQEQTVDTLYGAGDTVGKSVQTNGYVITGDSNIVRMRIVLKYKISDPIEYALRVKDVPDMLRGVMASEITGLVTRTTVDNVLTTEKSAIATRAMKNAQAVIDSLGIGVTLTNVELTTIMPPREATEAFNNATSALVQKQTLIQQARDYRESAIPAAEAKAQGLIDDANAAQASKTARATEIAEEFNGLYAQYVANPDVIRNGVFRRRVAAILSSSGATVVTDSGTTRVVLP